MARKRAPGAGRKPRGDFTGKTATLTTRITRATRAALEMGAQSSGRSLSQEIEHRLNTSIRMDRQFARQRHVRALTEAIALVLDRVEHATQERWLDNPFTATAVRHALEFLVFHFAPQGEQTIPASVEAAAGKVPVDARIRFLTPTAVGQDAAGWIISMIEMNLDRDGLLSSPSRVQAAHVPDEWRDFARLFSDLRLSVGRAKQLKKESR